MKFDNNNPADYQLQFEDRTKTVQSIKTECFNHLVLTKILKIGIEKEPRI